MGRLTFEGDFCDISCCTETRGGLICPTGTCYQKRVWEKLKCFEDIGLSSEVIQTKLEILGMFANACKGVGLNRIRELIQADNAGLLLVMPCKVGDTVYRIWGVQHKEICEHAMSEDWQIFSWRKLFGRTVFLTREEAEAALKTQSGVELSEKTQSGEKRRADNA